jgi:hypothetical protein
MTGMYVAEGTRRGLIPGRTVIVPAHLVEKWRRDLRRYFSIDAAGSDQSWASGRSQLWLNSCWVSAGLPSVR